MDAIFKQLFYEMEKMRDTVLVTVIEAEGSAPRGVGAQMLVGQTGRLTGTIGGGPAEYEALQAAAGLMEKKSSERRAYNLSVGGETGAVCGGSISVWLQFIPAGSREWYELARRLVERLASHSGGWLVQRMDGGAPSLLDETGGLILGRDAAPELSASAFGRTEKAFSLALPIGERAVIFGAGHCTTALVPVLRTVGFRPVVMDDRPEFASAERFPDAEAVICGDYLHIADFIQLSPEDYVVVMTSGHNHDFEVQEQVLRTELAYVGVIGSRRKTAYVNARLREAGIGEDAIASVHTPIGTAIKAVTPEEIAISIAGEMICERATRREKNGTVAHRCPMH